MVRLSVEERSSAPDATPGEFMLLGSVYVVLGRVDEALAAYADADSLSDSGGAELMEFAATLKDEGLMGEARAAYHMIVERYPNSRRATSAGFMAAEVLVDLGDPEGAVEELLIVGESVRGGKEAGEALVRAARIQLEELHRSEATLRTTGELLSGKYARYRDVAHEARLIKVRALASQGLLDRAYDEAASLVAAKATGEINERAMYDLGFISFLKHEFDRSLGEFREMVEQNMAGKLVNDALRFMLLMSDPLHGHDPLIAMADAHAALLAWDYGLARAHLTDLVEQYAGSPASAEGLMMLGGMTMRLGDFEDALGFYRQAAGSGAGIAFQVEAMMRIGDVLYAEMGRGEEAILEYDAILERFPDSFLAGEARRKIDRIRKEVSQEG
jgi:TolA-binding protein